MSREDYASVLRDLAGLTSPDPKYLRIATPGDTLARAKLIADESSGCLLVGLGAQEAHWQVGTGERQIPPRPAYIPSSAPATLERRSGGTPMHPQGAMRLATGATPPDVGDGVWYGRSTKTPEEHFEHVASTERDGDTIRATKVAGGERILPGEDDEDRKVGAETIKVMDRTWDLRVDRWFDRDTDREIIGVVDYELMCERYDVQ